MENSFFFALIILNLKLSFYNRAKAVYGQVR